MIEDMQKQVARAMGVPASLLTGQTVEECMAEARALKGYRRSQAPKNTRDLFAEWLDGPEEEPEAAPEPAYPVLVDGGEVQRPLTPPSTNESFEDWLNNHQFSDF